MDSWKTTDKTTAQTRKQEQNRMTDVFLVPVRIQQKIEPAEPKCLAPFPKVATLLLTRANAS